MAGKKQLPHLLDSTLLIRGIDVRDADELAFMARMLVQATLPHSDPGAVSEFGRTNGSFRLVIQPGAGLGIPYGSYPRLVLAWLTTEAVRTKSRRLVLGDSLSAFMGEIGLVPTGGRWGTRPPSPILILVQCLSSAAPTALSVWSSSRAPALAFPMVHIPAWCWPGLPQRPSGRSPDVLSSAIREVGGAAFFRPCQKIRKQPDLLCEKGLQLFVRR